LNHIKSAQQQLLPRSTEQHATLHAFRDMQRRVTRTASHYRAATSSAAMAQHLATTDLPPLANERHPYAYNPHLTRGGPRSHEVVREAQRMLQVEDELDHDEHVQVHVQSLLRDKLQTLRSLTELIEADHWKYERREEFNPNVSRQF
jgi:stress response protein YsnF